MPTCHFCRVATFLKVEVLKMPTKEREAYREFEKNLQKDYVRVRHRLRNHSGSHTMEVLTLLSKFRQVGCGGGRFERRTPVPSVASGAGVFLVLLFWLGCVLT